MSAAQFSRRALLRGSAASLVAAGAFAASSHAAWEQCEPLNAPKKPELPKFVFAGSKLIAGLRPHRDETYLLKHEILAGKHIVHNYGHGGAGITMSWGCAEGVAAEVKKLLDQDAQLAGPGIAVMGGGVMGLTAASTLSDKYPGLKIKIYARESYPETTSRKAGGQWAPSSVKWKDDEAFNALLGASLTKFKTLLGEKYGVRKRTKYTLFNEGWLEIARQAGLVEGRCLPQLPFSAMNVGGYAYDTYLIEPPVFLKTLHNAFLAKFGPASFESKTFAPPADDQELSPDIAGLKQNIIINCTGLGAGKLFKDKRVRPIKGHLLLLTPQPKLDYLFSGYNCHDWVQYMFPRSDGVVIGGTYQEKRDDERTSEEVGKFMLRRMKQSFEGTRVCDDAIREVAEIEADDD